MDNWKLIFEDHFDNEKLDLNKWNIIEAGTGFGNRELQYYTARDKNIFIRNHMLIIKALEEQYLNRNYTSAKITTDHKFSFQYGMVEVRAKLPKGQGMWPAIWMMPAERLYGSWPSCGEIDIMESLGHNPEKIYGTIHYGMPHIDHGPRYLIPGYDENEFYTYKILWDEKEISWFVNDFCYGSTSEWFSRREEIFPYPAPFNQPFYLILNLAVGGNFPGNPDQTTLLPQEFVIDYVKVYQKESD
jgi:beta-glucanase (GH16 family)